MEHKAKLYGCGSTFFLSRACSQYSREFKSRLNSSNAQIHANLLTQQPSLKCSGSLFDHLFQEIILNNL